MGIGRKNLRWGMAMLLWVGGVIFGMVALSRFANTPGASAATSTHWPANWPLQPASHGITLVVALHPRCTCSKATLGELEEFLARNCGQAEADVLIVRPAGTPDGWEQGDLWKQAAAIPSVHLFSDPDGKLSAQLGALTSGQTYAFDSQGRLLFSGGITSARGHMGDNAGVDALDSIVAQQQPAHDSTPVFGCPLEERAP